MPRSEWLCLKILVCDVGLVELRDLCVEHRGKAVFKFWGLSLRHPEYKQYMTRANVSW